MPFRKGKDRKTTESNFHDFRHGKTFSKTAKKRGVKKARKQMIAAVLRNKRESGRRR
jgi:hypothetical protein